jgi:hypothetical protein
MTGCDIKELDSNDINKVVDTILNQKLNLYSQTSNGYKYYVPRGVMVTDSTSYNEKLYSSGNVYYLYVDVVSYYFKKDSNYIENKDAYFSKKLDYKNKKGYLEITKINNLYFIEMMYNYAKVEALVTKDDIVPTIINSSYILSTLKFNDKIIKLLFDENILNFNEEQFKLFEPKRKEGNFLDYVKEYDQYEQNIDEDLITPDEQSTNDQTIDDSLE